MPQRWPWFERTFSFDFPAQKMPEILERLAGTPTRIAALLDTAVNDDELVFRESAESWSAKENLGHLAIAEPLWSGRIEDMTSGQQTMREADLTNRATWQAELNSLSKEQVFELVTKARGGLVTQIEKLDEAQWSSTSLHPRLKTPMRVVDLCHFVAEHDDYHIARARELMRLARGRNEDA